MAQPVIMPKLGQATEESTIVKWHKKEGDVIKKGDVLFEMETDKAVLEAESFFEGTLIKILVKEGQPVPVNVVVGYIGNPGEPIPATPPVAAAPAAPAQKPAEAPAVKKETPAPAPSAPAAKAAPAPKPAVAPVRPTPVAQPVQAAPAEYFISPRAKVLAQARGIDPSPIRGSGPNGRIVEKDVNAYLQSTGFDKMKITPAAKKLAAREKIDLIRVKGTGDGGRIMTHDVERAMKERPVKLSKMRQVIAKRLTESFTTTPHFYVSVSADMTGLMAYRKELKDRGDVYSVTDFILEAVILSLKEFPVVNSVTDGTTIKWRGSVELGMAVSLDEGLVVPVIKNAEGLSMRELHDISQSLAAKARDGKLLPDEMTGSSFTVSNMGMMDVDNFNAIINPGEGAILAVASTREKVVVIKGEMKIRSIMTMTLSVDHRIVDGGTGAAFVNAIKTKLEDVELWKSLTW